MGDSAQALEKLEDVKYLPLASGVIPVGVGSSNRITLVTFSRCGEITYFANSKGELFSAAFPEYKKTEFITNVETSLTVLESFEDHDRNFIILAAASDLGIYWINSTTKVFNYSMTMHKSTIYTLDVRRPSEDLMLSGSADMITLWDLQRAVRLSQFHCGSAAQSIAAYFNPPSGRIIVSGLQNGTIKLWKWDDPRCFKRFFNTPSTPLLQYRCICSSPDGRFLYATGDQPYLVVWTVEGVEKQGPHGVMKLDFVPTLRMQCVPIQDKSLLMLGSDGRLRLLFIDHVALMNLPASSRAQPNWKSARYETLTQTTDPFVLDFVVAPSSSAKSSSLVAALVEDGGFRLLTIRNLTVSNPYPLSVFNRGGADARGGRDWVTLEIINNMRGSNRLLNNRGEKTDGMRAETRSQSCPFPTTRLVKVVKTVWAIFAFGKTSKRPRQTPPFPFERSLGVEIDP
ncbi:hypothetical protein TcWFU_006668 [Taenia crassiceps]|uniref:Uncharacterized protein n=1 Tax=Taenia crassiceps TaxID=6207 RepID=A0ABR4Q5P2_9CEST